jgi:hypothetical protein
VRSIAILAHEVSWQVTRNFRERRLEVPEIWDDLWKKLTALRPDHLDSLAEPVKDALKALARLAEKADRVRRTEWPDDFVELAPEIGNAGIKLLEVIEPPRKNDSPLSWAAEEIPAQSDQPSKSESVAVVAVNNRAPELPATIERILASERAQAIEKRQEDERTQQAMKDRASVVEAFEQVRYCTQHSLETDLGRKVSADEFYPLWADRIIALGQLLADRGLLAWFDDNPPGVDGSEPARLYTLDIIRLGSKGERETIVRRIREAEPLPFGPRVQEWLRRGLSAEIIPRLTIVHSEVGNVPEAGDVTANAGSQSASSANHLPQIDSARLDQSRCPGCKSRVPDEYSTLSTLICPYCGSWELHTGLALLPVAGLPGTPPEVIRVSSPFWQPLPPIPLNRSGNAPKTTTPPKVAVEDPDESESPSPPLAALLSAPDLARHYGLPVARVESALRRFRDDHPDCFIEVENRRQNEPQYLYRTADVRSVLNRLTGR